MEEVRARGFVEVTASSSRLLFLVFCGLCFVVRVCVALSLQFSKHGSLIEDFQTKASELRRDRPVIRNNDEWAWGMHSYLHCLLRWAMLA